MIRLNHPPGAGNPHAGWELGAEGSDPFGLPSFRKIGVAWTHWCLVGLGLVMPEDEVYRVL